MSFELNSRHQADCLVTMTWRRSLSENASLPRKVMAAMPVSGPSSISNTTSTRFWSSWTSLGVTVAEMRPDRRYSSTILPTSSWTRARV
ncbi:hypothetical protein D3C73_1084040 [compost metagenome]